MGNLPTDGPIRSLFLADEGYSIIGADYSQLEVLIEANLTHDPQLLKIINEGASKHDITAQGLGIPRGQAKTLNFALQYGAGVRKVSKILGVSNNEASDIFDRYWKLYSGVKSLKDWAAREVDDKGQITNLVGRVRRLPKASKEYARAKQHRQAYNFLVQGVAGYICNEAYSRMWKYFQAARNGCTLWSVHDEILCQAIDEDAELVKVVLKQLMLSLTDDLKLTYPLQAQTYGPIKCWQKA
jgi:DNA polymerase-1